MVNSYELTQRALEDLGDIWNYTFEAWSEVHADKYYQMLFGYYKNIQCGK